MNRKAALLSGCLAILLLAAGASPCGTGNAAAIPLQPSYIREAAEPYFAGITGCAVFFSEAGNAYHIYNQELAELATAPNSTFKILSCLMGLESGAIDPNDSVIAWDGFVYPFEGWNRDLDYKQAFRASAIWYYRQVLDRTGRDFVKQTLDRLAYGNCDISQWEGGVNLFFPNFRDRKSVNGFWQESSLQISPLNMVDVLYQIFHDMNGFSAENIALLREAMLQDSGIDGLTLYGKTGTGVRDETWNNAWYVGFYEYAGDTVYFTVRENEPGTTGQYAKTIALQIIRDTLGD